jgi:hypothetical protein
VLGVGVDDLGAAVPQREGGGLLPHVDEPVHVDQLGASSRSWTRRENAPPAVTDWSWA